MQLKYKCQYCGGLYKNLKSHINDIHKPKRFTCLICGFSTNIHYDKHLLEQHSMTVQNYYDKFYLKNDENLCKNCKKSAKFISLKQGYYESCGNKHCMAKIGLEKTITFLKKKYNVPDEVEITNISQFKEIQKIIIENNIKNHGVKNTFLIKDKDGVEKRVKTNRKNIKCDYPMQNNKVKQKSIESVNKNWGCDNVMQNHEIRLRNQQKILYEGKHFDSQFEVDFYKKLLELNIPFEYQPNTNSEDFIYYDSTGKKHKYEPDFKVGNRYIELKGLHFFENQDPNGKMINPFRRKDPPEIVAYRDDLMESKHQCMIKNNVLIITDLKNVDFEFIRGFICS